MGISKSGKPRSGSSFNPPRRTSEGNELSSSSGSHRDGRLPISGNRADPLQQLLEEQPVGTVDLRGKDLAGTCLRGVDLSGVDLTGATLVKADLRQAKLNRAILKGVNLAYADLTAAQLHGADVAGANLDGAILQRADLSRANLSRSSVRGADLRKTLLVQADLGGALLIGANLAGANLEGANLTAADLSLSDLRGANLRRILWGLALLHDAVGNAKTVFPDGFDWNEAGVYLQNWGWRRKSTTRPQSPGTFSADRRPNRAASNSPPRQSPATAIWLRSTPRIPTAPPAPSHSPRPRLPVWRITFGAIAILMGVAAVAGFYFYPRHLERQALLALEQARAAKSASRYRQCGEILTAVSSQAKSAAEAQALQGECQQVQTQVEANQERLVAANRALQAGEWEAARQAAHQMTQFAQEASSATADYWQQTARGTSAVADRALAVKASFARSGNPASQAFSSCSRQSQPQSDGRESFRQVEQHLNGCVLKAVEAIAAGGKLGSAVNVADAWVARTADSSRAPALLTQLFDRMLQPATAQYEAGNLYQAIALVNVIPTSSRFHQPARKAVTAWQLEWQSNRTYYELALKALNWGQYEATIDAANRATTDYWQNRLLPLRDRAHYELARTASERGDWQTVVDRAKRIETPGWQGQVAPLADEARQQLAAQSRVNRRE
jgi:uncharacterized protein YjbI with pentapeptide repeats